MSRTKNLEEVPGRRGAEANLFRRLFRPSYLVSHRRQCWKLRCSRHAFSCYAFMNVGMVRVVILSGGRLRPKVPRIKVLKMELNLVTTSSSREELTRVSTSWISYQFNYVFVLVKPQCCLLCEVIRPPLGYIVNLWVENLPVRKELLIVRKPLLSLPLSKASPPRTIKPCCPNSRAPGRSR